MSLSKEQTRKLLKACWRAVLEFDVPRAVKMANAVDWRWHSGGKLVPVTEVAFRDNMMNLMEMVISHAEGMGHMTFAGSWSAGFHYIVSDYDDEVTVSIIWGPSGNWWES